jgi:hypothetical protein
LNWWSHTHSSHSQPWHDKKTISIGSVERGIPSKITHSYGNINWTSKALMTTCSFTQTTLLLSWTNRIIALMWWKGAWYALFFIKYNLSHIIDLVKPVTLFSFLIYLKLGFYSVFNFLYWLFWETGDYLHVRHFKFIWILCMQGVSVTLSYALSPWLARDSLYFVENTESSLRLLLILFETMIYECCKPAIVSSVLVVVKFLMYNLLNIIIE